jgi:hypothetical protein
MFKITLTRYRCVNSCLYGFCLHDSKPSEKKRKHDEDSNLPNGSGYGDHIQLLQIFESWDRTNYDPVWCKENGMQVIVPFSSFLPYLFSSIPSEKHGDIKSLTALLLQKVVSYMLSLQLIQSI